ncbi:MAG: arabinose efflux permease family protein [Verrucomicrobiales bacterium]|nr:arabinose efflux permease family protein [Verrucomicrobiales bacterium]
MTDSTASTPGRTAWLMVLLLVPVALLNYMDRQMLAAMKTSMMTDLPDIGSKANWGLVLGTFKWVYALLSPVGGALADRLEKRYVICGSLFVWSAVTWWTGHTDNFQQLLAARALMGMSEAFYMPAALALITDFHLGPTRSRAVGFHQMGIYAGTILGGFAGYAADAPDIGWRGAFSFSGLAGVVYALPLFWLLKNPPAGTDSANTQTKPTANTNTASPHQSFASATATLFSNRNFLLLVACFTLPALAGWVVRDWMPDILKERFHLGQGKAGVSAVLYVQLACLAGVGIGGWLADRWMLLTPRGRILTSACGMLLFLPALFGVGNATTLGMAIGFLILFGLGWGFFDCNNMPILCQIVPPRLRATGYGFMNLVSIACGGFADWGFGALRDRHVPLNLIFGAFAALALLSALLILRIRPQGPESTQPA